MAWCPQDYCQLATAADDATVRVWAMDRSGSAYQRAFDHHNYSFADTHADALWGRFGVGVAAGAAEAAGASLEENIESLHLQQQQQQEQGVVADAACVSKDMGLVGPSAGAATTGGGSGEGGAEAAAVGRGVVEGAEGATPLRGGGVSHHPQRSICSPSTPQLPFWRLNAAAAAEAGGGGTAPAAAAAAVGAGSAVDLHHQHPLVQQAGCGEGVAGVDSSQPDGMDVEAGPAAAAVTAQVLPAAGGVCGGGVTDAASFFTPIRTRRKVKV